MHNNLIAARGKLQGPQTWDRDISRLTAGEDNERIWLDAVITPNVSLNNRVALTLAASLILPGSLICLATAWMGAWLVTPLVFLSELALGVMILWHARSLGQYRQRVCLTDTSVFVETRERAVDAVDPVGPFSTLASHRPRQRHRPRLRLPPAAGRAPARGSRLRPVSLRTRFAGRCH
jgi:hypothetical protein